MSVRGAQIKERNKWVFRKWGRLKGGRTRTLEQSGDAVTSLKGGEFPRKVVGHLGRGSHRDSCTRTKKGGFLSKQFTLSENQFSEGSVGRMAFL